MKRQLQYHALHRPLYNDVGKIKAGDKVLIYGASGGVGHFAVQLAAYLGAEVTAVCSTSNMEWVKNLGAHHVIDYIEEDFNCNGKNMMSCCAVGKRTFFELFAFSNRKRYLYNRTPYPKYHPIQLLIGSIVGSKKAKTHLAQPNDRDLDILRVLMEEDKLRPVIEKCFSINEIVNAHRHVESGRTKGKIILKIE